MTPNQLVFGYGSNMDLNQNEEALPGIASITFRRKSGWVEIVLSSYRRDYVDVTDLANVVHKVWTYFAIPLDNPLKHYPPHEDYLKLYVEGAERFGLPPDYIQQLRTIETKKTSG